MIVCSFVLLSILDGCASVLPSEVCVECLARSVSAFVGDSFYGAVVLVVVILYQYVAGVFQSEAVDVLGECEPHLPANGFVEVGFVGTQGFGHLLSAEAGVCV